jgi:fido (protein-threonine AMPylation protein)
VKLFDCPKWIHDDDTALPGIAQAASAFFRFIERQNPKSYLLTQGDIKQWHLNLFGETVPVSYYAGHYRGEYPNKPCLNTDVHVGDVFGTPAAQVEEAMHHFSEELVRATKATDEFIASSKSELDRIKAAVQLAAMAGGSIIQIHPFVNGNGRMARLIMNFFLHRISNESHFSLIAHPILTIPSQVEPQ